MAFPSLRAHMPVLGGKTGMMLLVPKIKVVRCAKTANFSRVAWLPLKRPAHPYIGGKLLDFYKLLFNQ
jgi:hypothetical protein